MPTPGEVNVIFRGLFLIMRRKDFIEVIVPNMGLEHVNKAGTFLGELALRPRPVDAPYILKGVQKGAGAFPAGNVVLQGYDIDKSNKDAIHAVMILPVPKEILSFRPVKEAFVAEIDPAGLFDGAKPYGIHVFRYDAKDLDQVALVGHAAKLGTHAIDGIVDGGGVPLPFINLHLVAEPTAPPDPEHPVDGFHKLIDLFPDLRGKIRLKAQPTNALTADDGDHKKQGFVKQELATAVEAMAMTVQFGIDLRNERELDGTLTDQPPLECNPILGQYP